MKDGAIFTLVCLLMGIVLSACGASPSHDALATQVAATIFATQTAQALMATHTPLPTPTFTSMPTETPTPTPTPTSTPPPTPTPTVTQTPLPTSTPTRAATATPTPQPPTPTPSQHWVLVADSAADFPGSILDRKWWYLWSNGRNNFIWQDMAQADNQCYHSPNDWTLEICRDTIRLDACEAGDIPRRDCSRGDAALLWKATEGGTYRFEWDSSAVDGETTLRFHKHLDFVGSQGPGMELPYSAVVEGVIDWELFFWVPQYDTHYRVKVYKLQE